ncbi:MAG: hypothetical protein ABFC67_10770 [Mizugakiibacter sp.]|uniref:hypothetical protein n=1 Tax=Mizugakiibacter sp. TaxID=1972610 RepID=UPI0031C8CE2E|nr:hypothetical protein [Xanthomonadaceae bacterium]
MKRILFVLVVFAVLLLTACATKPISLVDAKPVPADRLLAFSTPSVAGSGELTVVRDVGLTGGGCYLGVFVNHELAVEIDRGERATLYLPAGRFVVSAKSVGRALCGLKAADRAERAVQVLVERNDRLTYRLGMDPNGTINLSPL